MKMRFRLILLLLVICSSSSGASKELGAWTTNVELRTLGQSDLNAAYDQLLDFLFPRQLTHPEQTKCAFVLRFIPHNGNEHQLNLWIPGGSEDLRILSFEVQHSIQRQLASADQAQQLASRSLVTKRNLLADTEVRQLIQTAQRDGLSVRVPPGIAIDGDTYRIWMSCELNSAEVTSVIPSGGRTRLTDWMNAMWSKSKRLPATSIE